MLALHLAESPTRFLSTVQVGITLVGIISGAVGEAAIAGDVAQLLRRVSLLAPYSGYIATGIVVLAITYFSLVFGELVPKRLALNSPERLASITAFPMQILARVTAPFVSLLSFTTDLILRLLPGKKIGDELVTEDEIRSMIEKATRAGLFLETERELVERIFRLGDQRVSSMMVPRADIAWLDADASYERVRIAVATSSHSHFPVCEGSLESLLALRLLEEFRKSHTHIAFVFDEYGVVTGLITLNDIVEGLLGQIARHGEDTEPLATRRDDGSYLLDGSLPVQDLKAILNIPKLPHEDRTSFQTVAGFVMTHMGRIPRTGEWFTFDRFRFEVVDMDRHRIDKVLLTFNAPKPTSSR